MSLYKKLREAAQDDPTSKELLDQADTMKANNEWSENARDRLAELNIRPSLEKSFWKHVADCEAKGTVLLRERLGPARRYVDEQCEKWTQDGLRLRSIPRLWAGSLMEAGVIATVCSVVGLLLAGIGGWSSVSMPFAVGVALAWALHMVAFTHYTQSPRRGPIRAVTAVAWVVLPSLLVVSCAVLWPASLYVSTRWLLVVPAVTAVVAGAGFLAMMRSEAPDLPVSTDSAWRRQVRRALVWHGRFSGDEADGVIERACRRAGENTLQESCGSPSSFVAEVGPPPDAENVDKDGVVVSSGLVVCLSLLGFIDSVGADHGASIAGVSLAVWAFLTLPVVFMPSEKE